MCRAPLPAGALPPDRLRAWAKIQLLATNPAKLFGLYPKKGTVAVGSDADIVVFDPGRKFRITAANQHSKTDYNLYEGTEVTGTPEVVLLRGNVLVEGDYSTVLAAFRLLRDGLALRVVFDGVWFGRVDVALDELAVHEDGAA